MSRQRRRQANIAASSVAFLYLALVFHTQPTVVSLATERPVARIKVCQNKDCCQRFQGKALSLVETMEYLLSDHSNRQTYLVESSGCLSQCGKGPNIQITTAKTKEQLHHQVESVHSAAAVLELSEISVHPTLLAAVKVLERAKKASTLEEKESCLNSVISKLETKPEIAKGVVMAHALVMRAELRLGQGGVHLEQAKADALKATELNPLHPTAFRVLADVYEAMGDTRGALQALSQWGKANPAFRNKVAKEMQRLQQQSQR